MLASMRDAAHRRYVLWCPEVKALHDAIEANKAAAARCKEKVAQVEEAMASTALILNLWIFNFVVYMIGFVELSFCRTCCGLGSM